LLTGYLAEVDGAPVAATVAEVPGNQSPLIANDRKPGIGSTLRRWRVTLAINDR